MIPEFPKFKLLGKEHLQRVSEFLMRAPRTICDLSLTNIFAWQDCENPLATLIHGNLCILIRTHREPDYFLEPLGENRLIETAEICLKHAGRISRAGAAFAGLMPQDRVEIVPLRDHFDYVFEVISLAELKGKKFDGKRNQVRKFVKNQPEFRFVALEARHRDQALGLFEKWARERHNGDPGNSLPHAGEDCQRKALTRAFDNYHELGLKGGAVFVGDAMEGFLLGSEGGPDTAICHFQYATNTMPGIYQLLLQSTCREILASYRLVNLEEDLGIPGLRKTKLSYQPLRIEEKFLITLK